MANRLRADGTALWEQIERHSFDAPGATQPFDERLARENGWTIDFARRAIAEYRRFVFLFAATDQPVAPSDIVDQVWHLHLLYTRNYWDIFCKQVMGKPLHHEPAEGVDGEQATLGNWYASTIERYKAYFGEPPGDIWPTPAELAATPKTRHQRIDLSSAVVLSRQSFYRLLVAGGLLVLALLLAMVVASNP